MTPISRHGGDLINMMGSSKFSLYNNVVMLKTVTATRIICIRFFLYMYMLRQTNFDLHHDVYLGGSCNKYTTWRAEIAIPIFESANISYFNPRSLDFKTNNIYEELRAKCGSLIIMYVVDSNCRGLSTMIDAVEMISKQEQRIVLVVKDVIPGMNPTIDPKEYKDLNRARAYLADVATRHGLLVYSSVVSPLRFHTFCGMVIKYLETFTQHHYN